MEHTGIPLNFGTTVVLAFLVGSAIAGQTFYLFTVENLKQFGTLKAMGMSDRRVVGMILIQGSVVGGIGYGVGVGLATVYGIFAQRAMPLLAFFLPWQVLALSAVAMIVIVLLASLLSIRRVLVLEPAVVFQGGSMNPTAQTGKGVTCRNLIKDYGSGDSRVRALRGVDLDIAPGELTLLVGPSGCGKTTLISILAGTLDPTSGDVSVLGVDLKRLSKREKAAFRAKNVGFVFQQFNLLPALTAAENVAVPLVINGYSKAAAVARATEVLKAVGLGDRIESLPSQLSGGQQQRVAIARALVHQPRLLVADEPTSAIDARTGQAIMELIRQVALQPDRVAVVVTHDARVFGFGDRIITLEDGRVAAGEACGTSRQERPVDSQRKEQAMIRKYVLPLLAVGLLVFAVAHALFIQRPEPETPPPVPPPLTPFGDTVAGAGMVEPSTEASGTSNIAIGSQLAGAVTKVWVRIGQTVKAGDLLFELDNRQTEADLKVRQAAVPGRAKPRSSVAEANLRQSEDQYERARSSIGTGAIAPQTS